jgi:hypothetical protein
VVLDQEKVLGAADAAKYGKAMGAGYAFTTGMDRAFLWSVPIAVLSFGLSFLLKEIKLRTSAGTAPAATPAASPQLQA